MIPTECPYCGHEYHFLIEPRPKLQASAKLTWLGGALTTVLCVGLSFCLPLPDGLEWISAWTILVYAAPAAAVPLAMTVFLASRWSRVVDLRCGHCQRTATICLRE
jgi:hypothetical protein